MKDKLYYIRGNEQHPKMAKDILFEKVGQKRGIYPYFSDSDRYYFVNGDNVVDCVDASDGILTKMLTKYGEELELPKEYKRTEDLVELFCAESGDTFKPDAYGRIFMYLPEEEIAAKAIEPWSEGFIGCESLRINNVYKDIRLESDLRGIDVDNIESPTYSEINDWNEILHKNHLHYSCTDHCMKRWFLPYDKVLVRNSDDQEWRCDIFSRYKPSETNPFSLKTFKCVGGSWSQCVFYNPYYSESLLGTTNKPTRKQL